MSKNIRKILEGNTQFYPQTHLKALVGYGTDGAADMSYIINTT